MALWKLSSRCSESSNLKVPGSLFYDNFCDFHKYLPHEACSGSFFAYQTTFHRKSFKNDPQMAPKADDKLVYFSPLGLQWLPRSPDALKICSQNSKSHHSGPQRPTKIFNNRFWSLSRYTKLKDAGNTFMTRPESL